MNSKNNVLLTVVLCILVLIIGFMVGNFSSKYFNVDKDNDLNSVNKKDNLVDIDNANIVVDNTKQMQLALGRYLYFLADAFYKNCDSSYFDLVIENSEEKSEIYVNNYGEILNSFTEEFKKQDGIRFNSSCSQKINDNKYDVSNCWCGSGDPMAIELIFQGIEVLDSEEDKIKYSVTIWQRVKEGYEEQDVKYKDTFTIKYIDNTWKIDEYTMRRITIAN
ncbi:MAG: hypothetical protein IJE89_02305 [Bacilli bacterium]|nr:hypothetical protein [Bacilli bacterium]